MDHMRKGSLVLDDLKTLVLDEADEMLRMGFIDDVEWVLEHVPNEAQKALFSATMPKDIRRIAQNYLNNPKEITIKSKTTTAESINQRYWLVSGLNKLDALTRILEAEHSDAIIIFVRTKTATIELTDKLQARGFQASALNGDIPQNLREKTIEHLKNGKIDIIVATDVAARGIDVSRVSHVINYDIPYDTEAYVHRIGRTGRAGKTGEAILFVAPRERRLLSQIERATKQKVTSMELPSIKTINTKRVETFKEKITETIKSGSTEFYKNLILEYQENTESELIDIAAALAALMQGETPLLLNEKRDFSSKNTDKPFPKREPRPRGKGDENMETYRVAVGKTDGLQPGNLVGAIANEINLDSKNIGRISIYDTYSTVDLPTGMTKSVLDHLKNVWVSGRKLNISKK